MRTSAPVGEYRPREQGLRLAKARRRLSITVGEYRPREQGLRPPENMLELKSRVGVGEYRPREQGLRQ